jgi:hypothetical protein
MTDHPNDDLESTEARLRSALSARADSVQPSAGDPAAAVAAGVAARRRRTFLTAAAVLLVVVALGAGAFVLFGDDGEDDVASGPESTTSTTAPLEGSGAPVIWPLPSMSVQYETPSDAADAFMSAYIGIEGRCDPEPTGDGPATAVPRLDVSCPLPPNVGGCPPPACAATFVTVEQRGLGWVVLGAESRSGGLVVAAPIEGAVVGAEVTVDVTGLNGTGVAELRPLGQPAGSAPTVDTNTVPLAADGSWHLILGAADGPVVLIVTDGLTATARVITVDSVAVPTVTTTTTTGPTDDGVQGWPGATSRHFDNAEAAATAFVTEVLGFAQPTMVGASATPSDTGFEFSPRPSATITTIVTVHDTGTGRGFVVTGVQSDQGTIDTVTRNGDDVTVTGSATAFEAQINVRLYDAQGDVLGETTAFAGANGEIGPFEVTIRQDVTADGPVYVQIAEGDASGEGQFTWATWAEVPA